MSDSREIIASARLSSMESGTDLLTNEEGRRSSEEDRSRDPLGWLTLQNKELREKVDWYSCQNNGMREKVKKLELGLSQWKLNASETNERLRRVIQNRDKPNYVDSFYDSQTKRLVQSLTEENILLKKELSIDDGFSNSVTKLSEVRKQNHMLKDQLQIRNAENKRLRNEMQQLTSSNPAINELKNEIMELNKNTLKLSVENTTLKNHTNNQTEIMNYLKSQFSKLRKEFIAIFDRNYTENGHGFIKQLKSLDGGEAPSFLSKPLCRSVSTNTIDCHTSIHPPDVGVPTKNNRDQDKDSGIDTLPEDMRELMSKSRELEEAKCEIFRLQDEKDEARNENDRLKGELKRKREFDARMERLLTKANEQTASLEGEVGRLKKERDDAKNDALSWKTALQQIQQEGAGRNRKEQEGLRQQTYGSYHHGGKEMAKVPEPFQTISFPQKRTQPVLVRDSGNKHGKSPCATETQDGSDYNIPRGPLSHSVSSPDMCSSYPPSLSSSPPPLPRRDERKVASLDYRTVNRAPLQYQCQKCKRLIDAKDVEAHRSYCDGDLRL